MNKTTEPAALAGIEPVAVYEADTDHKQFLQDSEMAKGWRWYRKDFARGAQLYSAATVERLMQERNGWIDSAREFSNGLEYYRDQLDACARHIGLPCFTADDGGVHEEPLRAKVAEEVGRLVQERDDLREWNKAMVVKAASGGVLDGYREMGEQLAASQAYAAQLRDALVICKREMKGDKWDSLYIDGVLAKDKP